MHGDSSYRSNRNTAVCVQLWSADIVNVASQKKNTQALSGVGGIILHTEGPVLKDSEWHQDRWKVTPMSGHWAQ